MFVPHSIQNMMMIMTVGIIKKKIRHHSDFAVTVNDAAPWFGTSAIKHLSEGISMSNHFLYNFRKFPCLANEFLLLVFFL